jgi:outer membrane protein TolC
MFLFCFVLAANLQLESLVQEALHNAPEIAAAQANVEAARQRIAPARTFADPMLSIDRTNGVMASQAIPWPGKLRLAGNAAASEAREVEQGMLGRAGLALEARVRNAWYDLVLARTLDRIVDDRKSAATQIEASVRERYATGLAVQQDVLRAQVELARLEEAKATQAATIASRVAELNRLTGAEVDRAIVTPDALPEDVALAPVTDLIAAASARSPELAASRQGIETGRIRIELAKKNRLPDFNVIAGVGEIGAGISIPLRTRQKSQLAEANALLRARSSERDAVARELDVRTRERAAQLEAALHIAALYRDKVLPLDDVSLESALASYQAGKVPFITVLDALNTVYSDRATYATRLAEAAKWRVAIDEALP